MKFKREKFKSKIITDLKGKSFHQLEGFFHFSAIISLINITQLSDKKVSQMWQTDGIKHSFNIFKVPLVIADLAKSAANSSSNINIKLHQNNKDIASITSGNAHTAEYAYRGSGSEQYLKNCIHAIADIAKAVSFSIIETEKDAVAHSLSFSVEYASNRDIIFDNPEWIITWWNGIVLQDKNCFDESMEILKSLYSKVVKAINSLDMEVTKVKEDLIDLVNVLFKNINSQNLLNTVDSDKYTINYNDTEFLSVNAFQEVLEKQSYPVISRTLIVGAGGAGKTTLFSLMKYKQVQNSHVASSTINIHDINDCKYHWFSEKNVPKPLKMSIWDFAGQSQYYGLHQSFFSNGCTFVVMTDSRHQQSIYDWLYQISILTEDSSRTRVIIFVNIHENCPSQINVPDLQVRFPNFDISDDVIFKIKLDNYMTGYDRENVKTIEDDEIRPFLNKLIEMSENYQTHVGEKHYNLYQQVKKHLEKKYYISTSELKTIAEDTGNITNHKELVEMFGLLVNKAEKKDGNWLSASWLNEEGYAFMHTLRMQEQPQYTYSTDLIHTILSKKPSKTYEYEEARCKQLLEHFYKTNLAVKIGEKVIIPALLPSNDPEFLTVLRKIFKQHSKFIIHIEYMQFGLFSQLVSLWLDTKNKDESENKLINEISIDCDNYSRYCCIFSGALKINKNNYCKFYLVIKWHPNFCQLTLDFYHKKDFTVSEQAILNCYKEILVFLLESVERDNKQLILRQDDSTVDEILIDESYVAIFVNALLKMKNYDINTSRNITLAINNIQINDSNVGNVLQGDHSKQNND